MHHVILHRIWSVAGLVALVAGACSAEDDIATGNTGYDPRKPDAASAAEGSLDGVAAGDSPVAKTDGPADKPDGSIPQNDGSTPKEDVSTVPPNPYDPCTVGKCWTTPTLSSACGTSTINEDFSSGKYNVHKYALTAPAEVPLELKLQRTGGSWQPALLVEDEQGNTIHDGEHSASDAALALTLTASGKTGDWAGLQIQAKQAKQLSVFVTAWHVVDSGFAEAMPQDAKYTLTDVAGCEPASGLLSPPNFDPNNVVGGFYLLPDSQPPGLYTRKADACSRGTKLLIDVIYTVAVRWKQIHPEYAPIAVRDLNEDSSCSTANHETHEDGTHADLVVECATEVSCSDDQPAIDLAKLLVDTENACGIINNNEPAQVVVNPYFESKCNYTPWHNTFWRSLSGHTGHFHIRVKKPDNLCN